MVLVKNSILPVAIWVEQRKNKIGIPTLVLISEEVFDLIITETWFYI